METLENRSRGSAFWSGLTIGLVAGAIAAVLWAPQPGRQTRLQLRQMKERGLVQGAKISAAWRAGRDAYRQTVNGGPS